MEKLTQAQRQRIQSTIVETETTLNKVLSSTKCGQGEKDTLVSSLHAHIKYLYEMLNENKWEGTSINL